MLPTGNSNKINSNIRRIILQSQLYGRVRDRSKAIRNDIIASKDGQEAIVSALSKIDALPAIYDVCNHLKELKNSRGGPTESFKNFSLRFPAAIAKSN